MSLPPLFSRSLYKAGLSKCLRRFHVSAMRTTGDANPDDFRRVPQSHRQFPNFSLPHRSDRPIVTTPKPITFAEVVLYGKTHTTEVHPGYSKMTGQPSLEVYEGAKMAASVVTEALAQGDADTLAEVATPEAVAGLSTLWDMEGVDKNSDLISMPGQDVLVSWIDNISQNDRGEFTALLVTYSFPAYGHMIKGLKNNKAREKEFESAIKDKVQQVNHKNKEEVNLVGEEIAKNVTEFKKTQFQPGGFFKYHPVVLSNFHFVKKNDEWLLDAVRMTDAKEVINPFSYFKWRGRTSLSF